MSNLIKVTERVYQELQTQTEQRKLNEYAWSKYRRWCIEHRRFASAGEFLAMQNLFTLHLVRGGLLNEALSAPSNTSYPYLSPAQRLVSLGTISPIALEHP